jgi:hypothetical protein
VQAREALLPGIDNTATATTGRIGDDAGDVGT